MPNHARLKEIIQVMQEKQDLCKYYEERKNNALKERKKER